MSEPIHPDDPRLTAYALGELDEGERVEIERQLAGNAECQAYVAELRQLAGQITGSLTQEPVVELTAVQHTAIEAAAVEVVLPTAVNRQRRRTALIRFSAGVAAMVMIASTALYLSQTPSPQLTPAQPMAAKSGTQAWYSRDDAAVAFDTVEWREDAEGSNSETGNVMSGVTRSISGSSAPASAGPPVPAVRLREFDMPALEQLGNDLGEAEVTGEVGAPTASKSEAASAKKGKYKSTGPSKKFYSSDRQMAQLLEQRANLPQQVRSSPASGPQYAEARVLNPEPKPTQLARRELQDQTPNRPIVPVAKPASESAPTGGEAYESPTDNPFLGAQQNPLSTFSIDVDTASYANTRRFLTQGQLPPPAAVRLEELLNYFSYDYPQPNGDVPFSVNMEVATCPWNGAHHLLRVGLRGKEIKRTERPVSNLVFLLDVSGSMHEPNKLPLVKTGMQMLVDNLSENDRVAIVVYAGASGLVLDSTTADKKQTILTAIENLQAGGSTNGGAGIELAYRLAAQHFIKGGTNRVILCTDGDFNVGTTSRDDLVRLVTEKAKTGVFLSVLGFGMGNLKDAMLEQIADRGNGNYAYIDSLLEAKKVLVDQLSGTLVTIAKDVKIQIEFNPIHIASYRLLGYENRLLAAKDFHDDTKDAGEVGAGHTVTALYELVPAGAANDPRVDPLKYQPNPAAPAPASAPGAVAHEMLTLKLRYKQPDADTSRLLDIPLANRVVKFGQASADFKWATAVASFGMILRHSPHRGESTLPAVLEMAEAAKGEDASGYRAEFIQLVRQAQSLGAK